MRYFEDDYNNGNEELLYTMALTIVDVIGEKRRLEKENGKLKEELKRHNNRINQELQDSRQLVGSILTGLVKQASK